MSHNYVPTCFRVPHLDSAGLESRQALCGHLVSAVMRGFRPDDGQVVIFSLLPSRADIQSHVSTS